MSKNREEEEATCGSLEIPKCCLARMEMSLLNIHLKIHKQNKKTQFVA